MWAQSGARASMGTNPYSPFAASNGTPTAWGSPMSPGREGQPSISFTEEDAGANMVAQFGKIPKDDVRACEFDGKKDGAAVWNTMIISTINPYFSPWMMQAIIGTLDIQQLQAQQDEESAAQLVKYAELQQAYACWLLKRLNRARPEALALAKVITTDVRMLMNGTMIMQWIQSRGVAK